MNFTYVGGKLSEHYKIIYLPSGEYFQKMMNCNNAFPQPTYAIKRKITNRVVSRVILSRGQLESLYISRAVRFLQQSNRPIQQDTIFVLILKLRFMVFHLYLMQLFSVEARKITPKVANSQLTVQYCQPPAQISSSVP